ncbi:hypothetical protein BKA65DRAFT_406605 [Rhexocercosporidium sp. MPI-PUGE-AT-0058]|nr:hypothetical protein BKA65DRAFT_406605 [Rhexocercosporidium sp. MPI-PUGE-AT-0058]
MGNVLSPYTVTEHEVKLPGTRISIRGLEIDSKVPKYTGILYALLLTREYRWKKPRPILKAYRYEESFGVSYDERKFSSVCL